MLQKVYFVGSYTNNKTICNMYVKISKKFITNHLLIYLLPSPLGRKTKVPLWRIVKAIIYRLKTGCQWRELPMKQFNGRITITWQTVYYHFNKWSKMGIWKLAWNKLLSSNKSTLDLSSMELDGSHTPTKRGGQAVGYQGRKKTKTTNALFLTDKNGLPIVMSEPIAGNHNDIFEIENHLQKMVDDIHAIGINPDGLFMNADAGFDSKKLRTICEANGIIANIAFNKRNSKSVDNEYLLDDKLYKERYVIERTNAWIDAFKNLLVRFETKTETWANLHYLAFMLIFLRKHF